ncbi:1-acylglycerol-3-phosphate O-acyltransferase [Nocardia paucivorans]|uniref:1-acylglycerol-3-phosphate O-acyltransferase n=1 Tax=Nocardia paucivorans TaxID=114259 RepID=UPI0002ED6DD9|nr:1-acylglycerol-3-phosphate O-acyltransferase [Nocardia paucivorans]
MTAPERETRTPACEVGSPNTANSHPGASPGEATDIETLVATIRAAPSGPRIAAVFDFSAVADNRAVPRIRRSRKQVLTGLLLDGIRRDGDYAHFLRGAETLLAGRTEEELDAAGRQLFRRTYELLYPEIWRLIREHEAAGHTVVLVGSPTNFQLAPVAEALGIPRTLGTRMEVVDGRLTGRPAGRVLLHRNKADAVAEFAAEHGIEPDRSFAYTGSADDLALLSVVGRPVVVAPDPELAAAAIEHGWPRPEVRPRTAPSPVAYIRTLLGFAGLLLGALFGIVVKSYTRKRRPMADALMKYGTAATLRLCGVRIRVVGERYARSPRPAVFIFNHQSQFDVIVVPAVLGGGVSAVAKKELVKNPIFGPLMRFVEVTFIDRADTAKAKEALAPVVDTLRAGLSIAIAPEGTRSYSPQPGPFKKGAFHIARRAGVPVIPVVIRNAGEVVRRNSMIVRPGTVEVAILPPIDVADWDPNDMHEQVDAVRRQFLDTLRDWPC